MFAERLDCRPTKPWFCSTAFSELADNTQGRALLPASGSCGNAYTSSGSGARFGTGGRSPTGDRQSAQWSSPALALALAVPVASVPHRSGRVTAGRSLGRPSRESPRVGRLYIVAGPGYHFASGTPLRIIVRRFFTENNSVRKCLRYRFGDLIWALLQLICVVILVKASLIADLRGLAERCKLYRGNIGNYCE